MATLRATNLRGRTSNIAPNLPDGANITGFATATNVNVSAGVTAGIGTFTTSVVVGSAVTANAAGIIVAGIATATTFVGALTGDVTGNADTATSATTATTATNASGLTGTPNITVGDVTSANVINSKQTTSEHLNVTGISTSNNTTVTRQLTAEHSNVTGITTIAKLDTSGTLVESFSSTTTAWSTTNDLNITNGNLQFCSANLAGTNNTLDIISTTGINTDLAVGQALNITAITAVNASTAYVNHITIDGIAVTESWVGGSAPTDGGTAGYDTYSFNILKTGSETFICIANQVKTS